MEFSFGIDLAVLIKSIGYAGILAMIFAESGLLIGFFLPGDSLLFTAGFLASQNYLNIWVLTVGGFVAAVLGDNAGYAFGRRVGPRIFKRRESLLFNPKNLEAARRFYQNHGGKAIVLARFMPAIRTFAPILAGVSGMNYKRFFFYNVAGGFFWVASMSLGGYFIGRAIPDADRYIVPIVFAIIVVSAVPSLIHIFRDQDSRRRIMAVLKKTYNGSND